MFDDIINNPEHNKYLTEIRAGQTIFLEGDDSQDLYILISGKVDILKGDKKISENSEPGSIFGEMSFLLGARRTASVKAKDDIKVLRIPKNEAEAFLKKFPTIASELTVILARRLDRTSRVLFGLKEFSDQLPDAVLLTDEEGKILTWNRAAEELYGDEWTRIEDKDIRELFEDTDSYSCEDFLKEAKAGALAREKVLKFRHPVKGLRHISMNTTVLYDGHHNFQGILTLGRDVSSAKKLEKSYRRTRRWMIPFTALFILLAAMVFYGYPYFSKGHRNINIAERTIRDHLSKDYFVLYSLLKVPLVERNKRETNRIIKEFFDIQENNSGPVNGIILLDDTRTVFNAYSTEKGINASELIGQSYTGIDFKKTADSPHSVLTVYRKQKGKPSGEKNIEIAFEIYDDAQFAGWLIFQMDEAMLRDDFDMGEEVLENLQFKRP